ncbi:putative zinc finger protein zpr1 protein [Neofusicoccum parvum UCRNP2]|uniref:Putative zinc finger protein zpr1 protein n=1 Tax=Botryosphaeria parva (strain UCR-NP2) TaxID=1287680 RepID=R1G6A9_BOTPV|nr:putative zinc finger protein zpr1 protein [Neofusicoccum parvum UCRNP2]
MSVPGKNLAKDLFEDMGRKVQEAASTMTEDGEPTKVVEEIESLCMNCHDDGMTKLLLTRIPFFKEIVIMSFDCPHCGFKNAEVQPAGEIQPRGAKYVLKVENSNDLNRQVVKSDTCIFRIEDIDLEIPPGRGQLSNVEGILRMIQQDLDQKQEERRQLVPEVAAKIQEVMDTLQKMYEGERLPFAITVDDPAGNSWVEPSTGESGAKYSKQEYARTPEQNAALGLAPNAEATGPVEAPEPSMRPEYQATQMYPEAPARPMVNNVDDEDIVENQVYSFPASCPGCTKPCTTNMKMVNIPYFKQVVLMSTVCEHCGYRSNEVKTGGEVPELGRRITVTVDSKEDLSRDILKSESCAMSCPELNLLVEPGTMGGRFTTIEGLLTNIRNDLRANIFGDSDEKHDSIDVESRAKWDTFFGQLTDAIEGRIKFTIVLSDPLASSYVQSFAAPEPDAQMKVENYERTAEEEEDLGLTDMKTEGYEAKDYEDKKEEEQKA